MNWFDQILNNVAQARGYVLGPGSVSVAEGTYGKDTETFAPEKYGDYIATSNAVYTCITQRAQLLSSLPLKAYKVKANGERAEVTAGPLVALLQKVNPFWTFSRLVEMTEMGLGLWGKGFWFLERGQSGRMTPREIWWGRPDRVRVVVDEVNYIKGFIYTPPKQTQPIAFEPSEVIWFRYPNPLDEFEGLSPLAAARLAADYASSAMRANKLLFDNGIVSGGIVTPDGPLTLQPEAAGELSKLIERRMKGTDNSHRWTVLRYAAKFQPHGFTPKEAEFIAGIRLAMEDVARAYKWPMDLMGGQRTYENINAAYRAAWTMAVLPEARLLAGELTEQLLPMFPGQADVVEFDHSDVSALQEDRTAKVERAVKGWTNNLFKLNEAREEADLDAEDGERGEMYQNEFTGGTARSNGEQGNGTDQTKDILGYHIEQGVVSRNEARKSLGLNPEDESLSQLLRQLQAQLSVMQMAKTAGYTAEAAAELVGLKINPDDFGSDTPRLHERGVTARAYGDEEHTRLWEEWVTRTTPLERTFRQMVQELLRGQKASVLARLEAEARTARTAEEAAKNPFDMGDWVRRFREKARAVYVALVENAGAAALTELGIELAFDVKRPEVVRFIEASVQMFAREVNDTTWQELRASLAEGVDAGEGIEKLKARVEKVMGDRIASSSETIARTEVNRAANAGTLESLEQAVQAGVNLEKEWVAALDERTRPSHADAHGQRRKRNQNFDVGGASGPAPGQMGKADEDINCRCRVVGRVVEE